MCLEDVHNLLSEKCTKKGVLLNAFKIMISLYRTSLLYKLYLEHPLILYYCG